MTASDVPEDPRRPGLRPLSRTATRVLVIVSVLLAFAVAIGGALYLTRLARETKRQQEMEEKSRTPNASPADTLPVESPSIE